MRYVAIDFETANNDPTSACSVGLAKMEDGKIIDSFYSLILPPSRYFSPMNISIHGICPEDVAQAPEFDRIWPQMLLFIGENLLIAHNAPFDMGILRAMLTHYQLPIPPNHKLTDLSRRFGFDYQAHYALDDAVNCARLFHAACPCKTEQETTQFFLDRGIRFQRLTGGYAPLEVPETQGDMLL
jgi:DNA polymerase-3 subunit epsilon